MNIAIVGTGYVGLVTGTCFAEGGNEVVCVDVDRERVASLSAGQIPIYEPGLSELVRRNVAEGRLSFTSDTAGSVNQTMLSFISVGAALIAHEAAHFSRVR